MENYRINYSGLRSIIRNPAISGGAKAVLVDLLLYAGVGGKSFPSQETLGENHGVTPRQIRNRLNELYSQGYVRRKRSGYSTSNNYSFSKEIYFLIEGTHEKPITAQLGNVFPPQTGNRLPAKVFIEKNQTSSSQLLQQFEKENKTLTSEVEKRKFKNLCKLYQPSWIEEAIKIAASRGKTVFNTAYLSKILEEWKGTGKPQSRPVFQSCGENGCLPSGYIFSQERQTYSECECKNRYQNMLAQWEKEWGRVSQ